MEPKSGKPPLIFVNPFAIWTELALKAGEAIMASVQAASDPRKVAVIPPADAPAPKAAAPAAPAAKRARKSSPAAPARSAPAKSRSKTKVKGKGKAKRRAKR